MENLFAVEIDYFNIAKLIIFEIFQLVFECLFHYFKLSPEIFVKVLLSSAWIINLVDNK